MVNALKALIAFQISTIGVETPRNPGQPSDLQSPSINNEEKLSTYLSELKHSNPSIIPLKDLMNLSKDSISRASGTVSYLPSMPKEINNCFIIGQNPSGVAIYTSGKMNGKSSYYQCNNYNHVFTIDAFYYKEKTATGMSISFPSKGSIPFGKGLYTISGIYNQSGKCKTTIDWIGEGYSVSISQISYVGCNRKEEELSSIEFLGFVLPIITK